MKQLNFNDAQIGNLIVTSEVFQETGQSQQLDVLREIYTFALQHDRDRVIRVYLL